MSRKPWEPDPIDDLLNAAVAVADARRERERCVREAGYEAGYFCQRYRDEEDAAVERFRIAFAAAVHAALAAAAPPPVEDARG